MRDWVLLSCRTADGDQQRRRWLSEHNHPFIDMKGAKAMKPVDDKKVGKAAKDPKKPKRPTIAFSVFHEEFRKTFKKENPSVKDVVAVFEASWEKWKSLTAYEEAPYEAEAAKRKTDYVKLMSACNKILESMAEGDDESEKSNSEVDEESRPETCEAKYGKPVQKRKRGRSPILQAKRPKGNSCSRPPDQHDKPSVAQNNAIMNTEYQQVWPFMKQSAIWATIESLESYRQPPQKPHFSPLKKVKADYREGVAISHMVTFDNLFQNISKMQLTDPVDIIKDNLETLVNLETHGFDVGAVRARLNELLSWKDKVGQLRDMAKKDEEEFEKCKEEMNQLEVRIKKLQMKMEQNAKQIIDCELAFKNHAAAPL